MHWEELLRHRWQLAEQGWQLAHDCWLMFEDDENVEDVDVEELAEVDMLVDVVLV